MKLRVLALDYDGTIAVDGKVSPELVAALHRARAQGVVLVLVTGRILDDLRALFGDLGVFDAVVAENGAVLAIPGAGRSTALAPPVPAAFVEALRARGLTPRTGSSIVELPAAAMHEVLDVIRALELPLVCLFNRDAMMVLPQAVSKATGLREALRALRLSPHNAIAIGDAENDHELLSACEIGVAAGWGRAALRAAADMVLPGDGPQAVAPWLDRVASQQRIVLPPRARRRLVLGRDDRGDVVALAVRGRNVLIAGDPCSGKSWVAGLLCEQLVLQQYSVCVIDPEGDYLELDRLPGVTVLGGDESPPPPRAIARALRHGDVSLVLDLSRVGMQRKREWVESTLQLVTALRRDTGLPHRIVVDEAHYFLHEAHTAALLDAELAGYTLVTYRVGSLHPDVVGASECIVVTRETDPAEVDLLWRRFGHTCDAETWRTTLGSLDLDEAALLPFGEEAGGRLRRFRLAARLTHHVRHRHKYLDVPVGATVAFRFEDGDAPPLAPAQTLRELVHVLRTVPFDRVAAHVERGDFSRWIRDVFRDETLARTVAELEESHRLGMLPDFNGAVIHAIVSRYHCADDHDAR